MEEQRSVLIIDDDEFYREFYRSELSQHNFAVEFASDGEEGLEKALKLKPGIILLDIILPKKDGFEVLKDLKGNESTKNIPVIITSTLGNNVDILKLKEMGAINNFNKTTALPKDIALYIKTVLTQGISQAKVLPGIESAAADSAPTQISVEKAKLIFTECSKEIVKALTGLLNSAIVESRLEIGTITFADLEPRISEISNISGTILVYSEIQGKKPGLVVLSAKRDDALTLIKLLEKGSLGNFLNKNGNEKLLESFFNIMLTALVNKLSVSLGSDILSKPPSVIGPRDLIETFQKLNAPKSDKAILMRAVYTIESIKTSLFFQSFFSEETLEQVAKKPA